MIALKFNNSSSPKEKEGQSCYWVELPHSKYGINYNLKRPVTTMMLSSGVKASSSNWKSQGKSRHLSPFESMLETLNHVTFRFPSDTAIMYIREIFEPGDTEYGLFFGTGHVSASRLSQVQVDRLRLLILPYRRERILVAYLNHFRLLNLPEKATRVIQEFSKFQQKYSNSTSTGEKFDMLLGFSYAIYIYSAWMNRYERNRSREKVLSALARYWRHLLKQNSAKDLGLDEEFSFPAVYAFLEAMKTQIENIDMHDLPSLSFIFEASHSPTMQEMNGKRVSFDDDGILGIEVYLSP